MNKPRLSSLAVVVGAACIGLVACSSDSTSAPADTEPAPPRAVGPVYPLTGLPVVDQAAAARPAMVVKIDNDAAARPQSGLNAADIVFEQIIEGQTRFMAVFHSQDSDPVGPIRSGRSQDIDLAGAFDRPLFVWSGGNPAVTTAIEDSDLVELSALDSSVWSDGGFFRDPARTSPSDEYAKTSLLWTLAPASAGPPPQQFQYRGVGEPLVGAPTTGVDIYFEASQVGWRYQTADDSYLRTVNGEAHNDALGSPISSSNVVILVTDYHPSSVDERSPEADTIGFGEAWVFSGGAFVHGVWTRADRLSPFVLTGPDGPIALTPGRTWVELAMFGTFLAVP
ncbi:MAG: DUF3048 domain-containing protein [Actinobacteria bacterium]|nr:DUF3048 domain-containing protein [Actinomycetota bacterium]